MKLSPVKGKNSPQKKGYPTLKKYQKKWIGGLMIAALSAGVAITPLTLSAHAPERTMGIKPRPRGKIPVYPPVKPPVQPTTESLRSLCTRAHNHMVDLYMNSAKVKEFSPSERATIRNVFEEQKTSSINNCMRELSRTQIKCLLRAEKLEDSDHCDL